MIKFKNNKDDRHFFQTKYKSIICIEDISNITTSGRIWTGNSYWQGFCVYVRTNIHTDEHPYFKLDKDDYMQLLKYMNIINRK